LADFGLSKKIDDESKTNSILFGMIPYIDPKKLNSSKCSLNKKSDVYSVGVLLWEISSCQPPFKNVSHDFVLINKILNGLRERIIPGTPEDYIKLYTGKYN
jgi:serine/threonine protein kinase